MEATREAEFERVLRKAALAGDEAAWRTLYDRAFAPLSVFVRRRCGRDRAEADEVLQECWLVAVRRLGSFDPDRGSFLKWLLGIAANVLRNRGRGKARRAARERLQELPVAAAKPERDRESAEQIALAMAALDRRHRAVLRLKYEEQLSVREIAARWQESAKAVESLLSRARTAFRTVYRGLGV
jgi:RNA polymerase sigma-70 factor (ECF subfamily)